MGPLMVNLHLIARHTVERLSCAAVVQAGNGTAEVYFLYDRVPELLLYINTAVRYVLP